MFENRNRELDRQATAILVMATSAGNVYQAPAKGDNWLAHSGKAALVDDALLWGASIETLKGLRPSYKNHIDHLKKCHGLTVETRNGVKRFLLYPLQENTEN
jgi:hypothetical protein